MRESRYPKGYLPKIEYYQSLMNIAIMELDVNRIKHLANKLNYFIERQIDLIGMKKFEGRRTN